jgi:hypothetical protein
MKFDRDCIAVGDAGKMADIYNLHLPLPWFPPFSSAIRQASTMPLAGLSLEKRCKVRFIPTSGIPPSGTATSAGPMCRALCDFVLG